ELTHVVQQQAGPAIGAAEVSHPDEPAEVQARAVGRAVAGTGTWAALAAAGPPLFTWLQSTAGNHAVARMVDRVRVQRDDSDARAQRQVVDPETPLSAGQAARAVSFYQARSDLYPPDVIKKIQNAVKSPETGTADPAMAQGVARFQNTAVL